MAVMILFIVFAKNPKCRQNNIFCQNSTKVRLRTLTSWRSGEMTIQQRSINSTSGQNVDSRAYYKDESGELQTKHRVNWTCGMR